ncbi:MAG: prenyltransferase [Methylophilaceae bacterium]|nr:prenyltransferase [Methylophilaceae bacterium]
MRAIAEPTVERFSNPLLRYLAATRPLFLVTTMVACLIGLGSAVHEGIPLDPPLAGLTLLLAVGAHAAINVLNDCYDALNGSNDANLGRLYPYTGGSRFIQNGILTVTQTAQLGYGLLAVVVVGGLWMATQVGAGLLLIGGAGVFLGWAYSTPPFRLSGRGLGELCVLAGFLGIVIGADYVQRGHFDRTPFLLGLPYALLVTNLLYINQFPDRQADIAAGKRHWVARLPLTTAVRIYPLLTGVALGILVMLLQRRMIPLMASLSALPMLLSLRAAFDLKRYAAQPTRLRPAIRLTIAVMLGHGILLAVSLGMAT